MRKESRPLLSGSAAVRTGLAGGLIAVSLLVAGVGCGAGGAGPAATSGERATTSSTVAPLGDVVLDTGAVAADQALEAVANQVEEERGPPVP